MKKIQYSILKYYNSVISEECLYIGVLFHILDANIRQLNSIKNFKRLSAFDDEINIDFFKYYLESIRQEVENNIFNFEDSDFCLSKYIKTYVNELRFSDVMTICTDNENIIEDLTKLHLKYDYEKKDRLKRETEERYISEILKSNNIYFNRKPVIGKLNEPIRYDYQTPKYNVKIFTFKEKEPSRLLTNAKAWAYNALEMKEIKNSLYLFDVDITERPDFKIIINVLSEYAKTLTLQEGIEFLINNN